MNKGNWLGKDGVWYDDYLSYTRANNVYEQRERLIRAVNKQNGVEEKSYSDNGYQFTSLWALLAYPAALGIILCPFAIITGTINILLGAVLTILSIYIYLFARYQDEQSLKKSSSKYRNTNIYEKEGDEDEYKIEITLKEDK